VEFGVWWLELELKYEFGVSVWSWCLSLGLEFRLWSMVMSGVWV